MKTEIIEAGRWVIKTGLTWGTSGNISMKQGDCVYITASGTRLGELEPEGILVCDLQGTVIEGTGKPSKETGMHLEVYRNRPEITAVIHTSPFYTTMCACSDIGVRTNLFIESMYYCENMVKIPYHHAGSRELAEAVSAACRDSHVILMGNHGVLVYEKQMTECRTALEITEAVCKMNVLAGNGCLPLAEVPAETAADFLNGGYFKARR